MPLDTRSCFWFGTEDRAGWFATPLRGADSSPSSWGVDGTLLNGGGYGFHAFGSHKRFTYEWPQSSSPQTAQMMKSYRDGTYGRGLLYFLEPGWYTTNLLPAAWADPSMAIGNEAASLVYGTDPIAVPTSGGEVLGLPVTSAQYDLSSVNPQSVPSVDSSLFIPVPTDHTLFLGAFYSATGTAGVFATPVNNNGTFGATVRLTEKANSDSTVVTDQISGDIRGVRLWIGRSDNTSSTITLAAMCARLLETSDVVSYGDWTVQRTNLSLNPRGANISGWISNQVSTNPVVRGATPPVPHPLGIPTAVQQSSTGTNSALVTLYNIDSLGNTGTPARNNSVSVLVTEPGYSASGVPLAANTWTTIPIATPVAAGGYSVFFVNKDSGNASTTVRAYITASLTETVPVGAYFDGGTNPSGELERTRWLSTPGSSASVLETRIRYGNQAKQALLQAGPWVGGQGHSGCRFVGTPSYVNNGPVEGGRVGFAASFVEVGSWVYG